MSQTTYSSIVVITSKQASYSFTWWGRDAAGDVVEAALDASLAPPREAMASRKRHLTSSPVATSRGHSPSWFFIKGSAPCAIYKTFWKIKFNKINQFPNICIILIFAEIFMDVFFHSMTNEHIERIFSKGEFGFLEV